MAIQTGTLTPTIPIRVVVFDEHDATRLGSALILQREPWVDRCLLASERGQAERLIARHKVQVVVVDISNLGPFVSHVTDAIHAAGADVQIVLTSRTDVNASGTVAATGASSYLPPRANAAALVDAVRRAALGERTVQPVRARSSSLSVLNDRERQVLGLLATGATNGEIADQLHLSRDTIKKHATGIYRKLGVRNRTEATGRAREALEVA